VRNPLILGGLPVPLRFDKEDGGAGLLKIVRRIPCRFAIDLFLFESSSEILNLAINKYAEA
jgi:hypothetical protein